MNKWYTHTKADAFQGLVIDETTGANIAVTFDPAHATLVAAAPAMLMALQKSIQNIMQLCDTINVINRARGDKHPKVYVEDFLEPITGDPQIRSLLFEEE